MDDGELSELPDLGDFDLDGTLAYYEDDEDPEVAYHVGLAAGPRARCPYRTQHAIDEWRRGKADADRRDIYSMRTGSPPDHYRDPD